MQPWSSRKASTERGEVWLRIATSLNYLQSPIFRVNQRCADRANCRHSARIDYENLCKENKGNVLEREGRAIVIL